MNTGEPAFPIVGQWGVSERGMTLRDYFAAKAMQGLVACDIDRRPENVPHIVKSAYIVADAMLNARQR